MGNFYVSFTALHSDRVAIATWLRTANRKAFVGPTSNGMTVFYDEISDSQDDSQIKHVGSTVSKDLNVTVLAVLNHDDDVLCFWLFENGTLVDEYNSCPGYFSGEDETPVGGDANRLCSIFNTLSDVNQLDSILRSIEYLFAIERHEALSNILHLPWPHACLSFRYIAEGDIDSVICQDDFLLVP